MEPFVVFLLGLLIVVLMLFFLQKPLKKKKLERRILQAQKKIDDAIAAKDTQSLVKLINDFDPELPFEFNIKQRKKVIEGFRNIGLHATQFLIDILQDTNSTERVIAASLLGEIGDRRAVEPLIKVAQDTKLSDQSNLRESAMVALGTLGDVKAVTALIEVAENDTDANRRVIAGNALASLGDVRAFDILMHLLQIGNTHLNWSVRATGISVLGKHQDPSAISLLVDHLAIAKLGSEEFKDEVRMAAAHALAEIGESALKNLLDVINNPESESRHYACYALGWMGDVRALPELENLTKEIKIDRNTRGAARWAIDTIRNKN